MREVFWMRLALALLAGGLLAWRIYDREKKLKGVPPRDDAQNAAEGKADYRYSSIIWPGGIIIYLGAFVVLSLLFGTNRSGVKMGAWAVSFLVQVALYDAVLLLVLPLLRRYINFRVIALLWLLPVYLYLFGNLRTYTDASVTLCLPGDFRPLFWVWLVGFAAVLGWKSVQHLLFRRRLLKNAREVTDEATLALWQREQLAAGVRGRNYRLMISKRAISPVTVGLFKRTLRVVLPDRAYTAEELSLIFRHELIHIQHDDPLMKFELTLCTALCWFNPLMWVAMRCSADDLELSCDEMVLMDAGEADRRRYAELILSSAGDERGFTTCLSATARALRYRLRHVVQPAKRLTGGILAGAVFAVLLFTFGTVAVAYNGKSGAEVLFGGQRMELRDNEMVWGDGREANHYLCVDADALTAYLASLTLYVTTNEPAQAEEAQHVSCSYQLGEKRLYLTLREHTVSVTRIWPLGLQSSNYSQQTYYLKDAPDWAYLRSLLGEAVRQYPPIDLPWLALDFGEELTPEGDYLYAGRRVLSRIENGCVREPQLLEDSPAAIVGYPAEFVQLLFEWEPEWYTVTVQDLDGNEFCCVDGRDLPENRLQLADVSACYIVQGDFIFRDGEQTAIYRMEYTFEVELPEKSG